MKCPACDVTLVMADRQGIEIDYGRQCRGVWLDRGELDKIIERTAGLAAEASRRAVARPSPHYGDDYYRHRKKENLPGELFDF